MFTVQDTLSSAIEPAQVADHKSAPRLLPPLLLALLFLRTVWGMWNVRDLTSGDTASYYFTALDFSRHLTCSIAWSPLYTSYFGAWHWLNRDAYFVVIAHRIGILAILTVLIYLISRRLLAPLPAWFVTAWWLVLPINHNALYEVHLFAVIPVCLFWLVLTWRPSSLVRGIALSLLMISTVLMRNELLIAFGLFGAISVGYELWELRTGRVRFVPMRYLRAYGFPLLGAIAVIGITYWRSADKYPRLSDLLKSKHTLNVSQIYAFGYAQRHPEEQVEPWSGYGPLMVRDFGQELLTMREAFQANPKAMIEHFLWNAQLIPSGLQVSLFNCRSVDFNPDYADTVQRPPLAFALSAAYLVIVISGGMLLIWHRRYWWDAWIRNRTWVIAGILSICATTVVVMLMQRPRPSYIFTQTLALMWLAGFCLQVIAHHLRAGPRFAPYALLPMAAVTFMAPQSFVISIPPPPPATALMAPQSFVIGTPPPPPATAPAETLAAWRKYANEIEHLQPSRILLMEYRMLAGVRAQWNRRGGSLAAAGFPSELACYLGLPIRKGGTTMVDTDALVAALGPQDSLHTVLRKRKVRAVAIAYYQERMPKIAEFMQRAPQKGWKLVDHRVDCGRQYWLYVAGQAPVPPNP